MDDPPIPVTVAGLAALDPDDYPDGTQFTITDDGNRLYEARGADGARTFEPLGRPGIPAGGGATDVLTKQSTTDYDAQWTPQVAGSSSGGMMRSAHTTLTDTTTTGTTAIQWGTEEATIPDADLTDGDVTILAFVEGQMDASAVGAPDRGRIKIEASYDGGANWSDITGIEPILTIESASNDRGPWFSHHAHGTGTKTGDVMVRAMIRRNDTQELSFERGRLTLMAYAEATVTVDWIDGGDPTTVHADLIDGGSPATVHTDFVDAGAP